MKNFIKIFLLLLFVIFQTCDNDDGGLSLEPQNPITEDFTQNFGSTITAKFIGRIVDEQKEPISGVTINIGNSTAMTDDYGVFSIEEADAFEKFAYITAKKSGYIDGSRALVPSEFEANSIEIMLLKKDVVTTINSGQSSSVSLSNGSTVNFSGDFITENGTTYSGSVEVILKHLSPEDDNMSEMMPGMLMAQNSGGSLVSLETYGMFAVELQTSGGEKLQLAEGSPAQITMPLATGVTNPPNMIPLWYFDEEAGYWKEEGVATLQGNNYIGDVSHFTFWNYDYPYPAITLCITLVDSNGNLLPYTALDLYSSLLNSTGTYGYTNSNGTECGLVPANETMTVTVFDGQCNSGNTFTTTIGPFSVDSNITITVPAAQTVSFTGNFLSCDGSNVTNGYLQLTVDNISYIVPVTDGIINYSVSSCSANTYTVKGVDVENSQTSDLVSGTISSGTTTIDLGTFSACVAFQDSDGDGVFDVYEDINGDGNLDNDDTDQDGTPDYLDIDDDGDGVNTADEEYDGDNDPRNDDSDGDQIPDYLDPVDVLVFPSDLAGTGCDPVAFDLNSLLVQVYNAPNTTYEFYENDADANANTNPITGIFLMPLQQLMSNTQSFVIVKATNAISGQSALAPVYLFVNHVDSDNDGLTDCEEFTGIDNPITPLIPSGTSDPNDPNDPNPQTGFPQTGVLEVCDDDNDGFAIFDLNSSFYYFLNGSSPNLVSVTFYETQVDATNNINSIAPNFIYINISNPQFIYVRIEDLSSGNIQISILTLIANPTPQITQNITLTECDGNNDGFATFDLNQLDSQILSAGSANNVSITYHEFQGDATAGTNPLTSPYTNTSPGQQTIFVRVEDINTGCISTGTVILIVDSGC